MTTDPMYETYRREVNRVVHGTPEPTPAQLGRALDQRHGLWLPVAALRALKRHRTHREEWKP